MHKKIEIFLSPTQPPISFSDIILQIPQMQPLTYSGIYIRCFLCYYILGQLIMTISKYKVSKEKEEALRASMQRLNIKEADITERFIRASGAGGQKVNKTSSCVYLKHLPSGIEVKCQKERSQSLNRYFARKILVKKIEQIILGTISEEQKRIAKIKRQKHKRSKRAKEKLLKLKKIRSGKKKLRAAIQDTDQY